MKVAVGTGKRLSFSCYLIAAVMQPVLRIAALLKTFLISDVLDDTLGQIFPGTLASRHAYPRVPEIKWHDPVPFYLNTMHAPNNFICAK